MHATQKRSFWAQIALFHHSFVVDKDDVRPLVADTVVPCVASYLVEVKVPIPRVSARNLGAKISKRTVKSLRNTMPDLTK